MKNLKEIHYRWIGIIVFGILISFIKIHDHDYTRLQQLLLSLFFVAYYWNGAFLLFIYFRNRFPIIKQTPKRLLYTIISLVAFLIIGGLVPKLLLGLCGLEDLASVSTYFDYAHINFPASFLIGSIYEAVYFFDNWKKTIRVNESLKSQQIKTQFEVLQNQMSPHFLFNSLNTLTVLIAENQHTAIDFTQKLSDVYRYILRNKEKEIVTIREELKFVGDYVYLLQMRYPENLHILNQVADKVMELYIAPLTIQILVENAIKHNVISKDHPLTIKIFDKEDGLVIENNFRIKTGIPKSTKTGLENIRKRYNLLGFKDVEIVNGPEMFRVTIPIIKLVQEKDLTSRLAAYERFNN